MSIRSPDGKMWVFLLVLCGVYPYLKGADLSRNVQFDDGIFEGVENIRVLECRASGNIVGMQIWDKNNNQASLVSWSYGEKKCTGLSYFVYCSHTGTSPSLSVATQVLITDMEEEETRWYRCFVNFFANDGVTTFGQNKTINVTRSAATETTSASSTAPESAENGNAHLSPAKASPMFSNSVVIVLLVMLAIAVTAACVVGLIYCKRRHRKRRPRDLDALSMRSGMTSRSFYGMGAKGPQRFSFDDGQGMQTMTRQLTYSSSSAPPSSLAPEVPGYSLKGGRVMQYQKPTDCMPAAAATLPPVSEAAFPPPQLMMSQYQEPWGRTLEDPEILGRLTSLRSNRGAVVKIPDFDAASHPAPPSSPPTQETSRALMEERE